MIRFITMIIVSGMLSLTTAQSGSINNTLGGGGVYTIKGSSTSSLFRLEEITGMLTLANSLTFPNTVSFDAGVIYKGTDRFLHNFKASSTTGNNTFLGINSGNFTMYMLTTNPAEASYNTGVGYSSLSGLQTGYCNTAVGSNALENGGTASFNSAFGYYALQAVGNNPNHSLNVGIGFEAGKNLLTSNCTIVGAAAGNDASYTGANLILLGYNAEPSAVAATNEITLGNSSIASLRCNVTNITSLSDARDKSDIQDLNLGIDFLMSIKPRLFFWDRRSEYATGVSDGSHKSSIPTAGFIAQELDLAQSSANAGYLNLVLKSNPDRLEATPGNLLPVLVKSMQDLKHENDRIREELAAAKEKIEYLEKQLPEIIRAEVEAAMQKNPLPDKETNFVVNE